MVKGAGQFDGEVADIVEASCRLWQHSAETLGETVELLTSLDERLRWDLLDILRQEADAGCHH